MTTQQPINGNAMAGHLGLETFQVYARRELIDAPYFERGVCFRPECSKTFKPTREWQMYCCKDCEAKGTAEFRKWGHRLALPSLLHRIGKYETNDASVMARTRAARRYATNVQSEWMRDRITRMKEAK